MLILHRLAATIMFFTKLPLWKYIEVDKTHFKHVVPLWPLAGWLTAGLMMLVYWGASFVFPTPICILLALVSRLMLTGALHEDGYADFCDAFGCFSSRERTLEIMKDSHIGSYGVIGLIIYFLLVFMSLTLLPSQLLPMAFCADPFCKFVSANIINLLPYARDEKQAKNKVVYSRMKPTEFFVCLVLGMLPLLLLPHYSLILAGVMPVLVSAFLFLWMRKRIGGYTGDCCGATFILNELAFYLALLAICHILTP